MSIQKLQQAQQTQSIQKASFGTNGAGAQKSQDVTMSDDGSLFKNQAVQNMNQIYTGGAEGGVAGVKGGAEQSNKLNFGDVSMVSTPGSSGDVDTNTYNMKSGGSALTSANSAIKDSEAANAQAAAIDAAEQQDAVQVTTMNNKAIQSSADMTAVSETTLTNVAASLAQFNTLSETAQEKSTEAQQLGVEIETLQAEIKELQQKIAQAEGGEGSAQNGSTGGDQAAEAKKYSTFKLSTAAQEDEDAKAGKNQGKDQTSATAQTEDSQVSQWKTDLAKKQAEVAEKTEAREAAQAEADEANEEAAGIKEQADNQLEILDNMTTTVQAEQMNEKTEAEQKEALKQKRYDNAQKVIDKGDAIQQVGQGAQQFGDGMGKVGDVMIAKGDVKVAEGTTELASAVAEQDSTKIDKAQQKITSGENTIRFGNDVKGLGNIVKATGTTAVGVGEAVKFAGNFEKFTIDRNWEFLGAAIKNIATSIETAKQISGEVKDFISDFEAAHDAKASIQHVEDNDGKKLSSFKEKHGDYSKQEGTVAEDGTITKTSGDKTYTNTRYLDRIGKSTTTETTEEPETPKTPEQPKAPESNKPATQPEAPATQPQAPAQQPQAQTPAPATQPTNTESLKTSNEASTPSAPSTPSNSSPSSSKGASGASSRGSQMEDYYAAQKDFASNKTVAKQNNTLQKLTDWVNDIAQNPENYTPEDIKKAKNAAHTGINFNSSAKQEIKDDLQTALNKLNKITG